jgi:hypothetical protein
VLYVIDISRPTVPTLSAALPLGLTNTERGAGHIATFVTRDCSLVWVDGGNRVEMVDLRNPQQPRSLGKFVSQASKSKAFTVSHDSTLDADGTVWNVGGGGAAHYRLTGDPLKPRLLGSTSRSGVNPSPWNDFILHNAARSTRDRDVLLVTEEDYIDQSETPPGSCHGQGKFETWSTRPGAGRMTPIDSWQTELNGFLAGGSAQDSKAPFTVNCSSHWFDERAGVAAVAWYEQGVRLLDVRKPRDIRQVGYYLPVDGVTWGAYWAPNATDIVYTTDVMRGIDVLRVKGGAAGVSRSRPVKAPILSSWRSPMLAAAAYRPSSRFGWSCVIAATRNASPVPPGRVGRGGSSRPG